MGWHHSRYWGLGFLPAFAREQHGEFAMHALDLPLIVARHRAEEELAAYRGAAVHARHLLLDPTVDAEARELAELVAEATHRAWLLSQADCEVLVAHAPALR